MPAAHSKVLALFVVIGSIGSLAQTTAVTTPGGATNAVPKFSGTGTITNSAITEVNGSVGIGTTSPDAALDVRGSSSSGPITSLGLGRFLNYVPVDLHIDGDPGPAGYNGLWISSGTGLCCSSAFYLYTYPDNAGTNYPATIIDPTGNAGLTVFDGGGRSKGFIFAPDTPNAYMDFRVGTLPSTTSALRINGNGNVGLGTTTPGAKLEVNGSIKLSGSNGTLTFPDGSYLSSAANLTAGGGGSSTSSYPDITDSNSKVGIGTTSPQNQLSVQNGLTIDQGNSNSGALNNGSSSGNGISFGSNSGEGLASARAGGSNPFGLDFYTNYARRISITQGGAVGIGITSPQATLDVAGVINGRNFAIPGTGGSTQWAKIGTFSGAQIGQTVRLTAYIHEGYNASNSQDSTYVLTFKTSNGMQNNGGFYGNGSWYAVGSNSAIPPGNIRWVAHAPGGASATSFDLFIYLPAFTEGSHYAVTVSQDASWVNAGTFAGDPGPASSTVLVPYPEFDLPYGNVGIGTASPGAKLEVNGNIKLTAGSGASMTFPDNTIQSTAWNGTLSGGDYAESVDVTGDSTQYEPGDVLVIDSHSEGRFQKASEPYSTAVMGIYSTKPGVVGRRQKTSTAYMKDEVPMAMIGVVPTKVSAENGPIKPGDLLVTSSMPGYAMKGTNRSLLTGAVVGKAMGHLNSGSGLIEVAVSLQ